MRLDEWQKYLETQFLSEASPDEAGPPEKVSPAVSNTPVSKTDTPPVTPATSTAPIAPAATTPEARRKEAFAALAQPDRTPTVIEKPTGPPPRVLRHETPAPPSALPEPPPAPSSAMPSNPFVSSPGLRTNLPPRPAPTSTEPTEHPVPPSSNVVEFSAVPPKSGEEGTTSNSLFGALPDVDTEIPAFARYLPASRGGEPVRVPSPSAEARPSEVETQDTSAPSISLPTPADVATAPAINLKPAEKEETEDKAEAAPKDTSTLHDLLNKTVTETETDSGTETEIEEERGLRRVPRTRARHARNVRPENVPSGLSAAELWMTVPRHVQTLLALERLEEEEIAQYSYKRPFQEKRRELIERLLDPILSLEDTARLLNVCPTTVRRYTNKGILTHYRKEPERTGTTNGGASATPNGNDKETRQRRFRLSDILAFLEAQQAALESDQKQDAQTLRHQEEAERIYGNSGHTSASSSASRTSNMFSATDEG